MGRRKNVHLDVHPHLDDRATDWTVELPADRAVELRDALRACIDAALASDG